jgi:hypothetical protein
LRARSSRNVRTALDHALPLEGIAMNGRLMGFVRRLLRVVNREWGLGIDARSKRRIKAAAEERFREAFPNRHVSHSRIWSDEEGRMPRPFLR